MACCKPTSVPLHDMLCRHCLPLYMQRAAADARMDALALGTAPAALPAPTLLSQLLATAADSLAVLQGPQPPLLSQQQRGGGTVPGGRRRLFPTSLSGAPVSATAAAAAAAMGLEQQAEEQVGSLLGPSKCAPQECACVRACMCAHACICICE